MIIVKIKGGPGNQFFQYSFGKKVSKLLNTEMKLYLDYDETIPDTEFGVKYVLDKYEIKEVLATREEVANIRELRKFPGWYEKIINVKGLTGKIIQRFLRLNSEYFYFYPSYVTDPGIRKEKSYEKIRDNSFLDGYWGHLNFFEDIQNEIRSCLKVKNEYLSDVYYNYESLINSAVNSVSLHIRRGTYENISWINSYFGLIPADYYHKAIKLIESKTRIEPTLFLFSNDMEWTKENLKFNYKIHHVICGPGNDFLENQLMSKCQHNIVANSTFSWWAAWLNQNPEKIVIAPEKWYKNPKAQMNYEKGTFIPETWIKL
jgi:hypothetical protein